MSESAILFVILGLTFAALAWGRLRYDLVALLALLAGVTAGVIEADGAFAGFGHPAVITVGAVLVLSQGFQRSGLVDWISGHLLRVGGSLPVLVLVLTGGVAGISGFMNNVGALALLLPVALRVARVHGHAPSRLLMPLAFGSLLGGLMTLIGTPPNIIISAYRAGRDGEPYGMFSFLPVGGGVTIAGVAFLALLGWRLAPRRQGQASPDELFETAEYISELEVVEGAKAQGWTLQELADACGDPLPVVAVLRGEQRRPAHAFRGVLRTGDVLLVEAEPAELKAIEDKTGFTLAGSRRFAGRLAEAEDLQIVEAVVRPESPLIRRTVAQLRLLDRHALHLLAVARDGARLKQRLRDVRFQAGDVLLLQGDEREMSENLPELGCLPLAGRDLALGRPRRLLAPVVVFGGALLAMLVGGVPVAVALTAGAVAMVLAGVLPLRDAYRGIDWPVIVLLAAMMPLGQALETSGGAQQIADGLLRMAGGWPPAVALALLFLITLLLSNVINNAAAALLMAPIADRLAAGLGVSMDPFLMAVAVSASCAFLTPIGHQSNTLVLGPGGYRFGDYWRVGLPLTGVVMLTAVPLILWVWPLS